MRRLDQGISEIDHAPSSKHILILIFYSKSYIAKYVSIPKIDHAPSLKHIFMLNFSNS
jgi:hypothetical protein